MNDLKGLVKMKNIPMWKIAETIGIHPSTLCVWMRTYNAEHYEKILNAINKIEGGEESNDENN